MKCKLLHDTPKALPDRGYFPQGTVLDSRVNERFKPRDIAMLVLIGAAVADDDECRNATKQTPQQTREAQRSYGRSRKGIHPDDFAEFDAGIIDGYGPDGKPIPGPNYTEDVDEEDEPNYEDDDDD